MMGLSNIFEVLGTEPLARWLAAALALRALWTVVAWRRCARAEAGRRPAETLEAIEARRNALWRHNWRFYAVMSAGIGLAVAGLYGLAVKGDEARWALVVLLAGMYVFLTEPSRREIADAEDRVAVAVLRGGGAKGVFARTLLGDAHRKLAFIEVSGALALAVAIAALAPEVRAMM